MFPNIKAVKKQFFLRLFFILFLTGCCTAVSAIDSLGQKKRSSVIPHEINIRDDIDDLNALSQALDEQDSEQLASFLRQADTCIRKRDYVCSEKFFEKARKLINSDKDKIALQTAIKNLDAEKIAEKREEEVRIAEQRRREAEERAREEEIERQEEARREREQRQAMADDPSPDYSQILSGALASINSYALQSARQVANAQQQAQMINLMRQREVERRQRELEEQRQERLRQERQRDYEISRQRQQQIADQQRIREQQSRVEQQIKTEQMTRTTALAAAKNSPLSYGTDAVPVVMATAERTKQQRSQEIRQQEQRDQELAEIAKKMGQQANDSSGAMQQRQTQESAKESDCKLPNGRNVVGHSAGWSDCTHDYKLVVVDSSWNDCEATREAALQWAQRGLQNAGMEACWGLGTGWTAIATNNTMFKFPGMIQTPVCKDGKSWRAEISKATVACQRPK